MNVLVLVHPFSIVDTCTDICYVHVTDINSLFFKIQYTIEFTVILFDDNTEEKAKYSTFGEKLRHSLQTEGK